MKAAVYIDGFNLYYGLAVPLLCKWVNLESWLSAHFPDDEIRRIYFFEAMVIGSASARQEAYLNVLRTQPIITVVLGEMKPKPRKCKVAACTYHGDKSWRAYEEKHTDVSIAIAMVDDAYRGAYEKQILLTADTDLVPAVRMVKNNHPHQRIHLCIPGIDKSRIWGARPIGQLCDKSSVADADLFLKHQFSQKVTAVDGTIIQRPTRWREAPLDAAKRWRADHGDRVLATRPTWCR